MIGSEYLNSEEKNWAVAINLITFIGYIIPFGNIIGPLVIWLMKKEGSDFIDEHGKAVINFQISIYIWFILAGLLCMIFIGFFFVFALILIEIIYTIINAIKAKDGKSPKYPFSIKFIA